MKFELNKPFETVLTTVDVDPGLLPGSYRFRLVVVGARGRRSAPAEVVVTVVRGGVAPPVPPVIRPVPVTPVVIQPVPIVPVRPVPPPLPPPLPTPRPAVPRTPRRPTPPAPP